MVGDGDRNRYRQVILQRSRNPTHLGYLEPHDGRGYAINPLCGDVVEVTLQLSEDGESIASVRHRSDGCAVCIAATDLMIDMVMGQPISKAKEATHTFKAMLKGSSQFPSNHPLAPLSPLADLPGRKRCASLGWDALEQAIQSEARND
jgi:nitrogen fixation NifU-like protein